MLVCLHKQVCSTNITAQVCWHKHCSHSICLYWGGRCCALRLQFTHPSFNPTCHILKVNGHLHKAVLRTLCLAGICSLRCTLGPSAMWTQSRLQTVCCWTMLYSRWGTMLSTCTQTAAVLKVLCCSLGYLCCIGQSSGCNCSSVEGMHCSGRPQCLWPVLCAGWSGVPQAAAEQTGGGVWSVTA